MDNYKARYEFVFQADSQFSSQLMDLVKEICYPLSLPKEIRDNVGTELDFKGYDLTMTIQIGVRLRRFKWAQRDEFTQDDKERDTMTCDCYFLGYAAKDESQLFSYMIFNYADFVSLRNTPAIPLALRKQNWEHSRVWFSGWRNRDILNQCRIYASMGNIGRRPGLSKFEETKVVKETQPILWVDEERRLFELG